MNKKRKIASNLLIMVIVAMMVLGTVCLAACSTTTYIVIEVDITRSIADSSSSTTTWDYEDDMQVGETYYIKYEVIITLPLGVSVGNLAFDVNLEFDNSSADIRKDYSTVSLDREEVSDVNNEVTSTKFSGEVTASFEVIFAVTPLFSQSSGMEIDVTLSDDYSIYAIESGYRYYTCQFVTGKLATPTIEKELVDNSYYIIWDNVTNADYYLIYEGYGSDADSMDFSRVDTVYYGEELEYEFTKVVFATNFYAYYIVACNNDTDNFANSDASGVIIFD